MCSKSFFPRKGAAVMRSKFRYRIHRSTKFIQETMSDVELDAEEMSQDEMETENVEGVHKKTGEIHKCK